MVKSIYILEYYEEMKKENLTYDRYSLIGIFSTRKEAEERRIYIVNEGKIREDTLYVSLVDVGKSQWKGGFISE